MLENLLDGLTTSVYNNANRLLMAEALSGITTYSYDAAGNRLSVEEPTGDLTTLTWNGLNQRVELELPDGTLVTTTWDPVNKLSEERIVRVRSAADRWGNLAESPRLRYLASGTGRSVTS